jgi:hypothetical protein
MSEQQSETTTERPTAKSEKSEQTDAAPETTTEDAEGREVHVTRDDSGITSMSEDEAGADPRPNAPTADESNNDPDDTGHAGDEDAAN